MFIPEASELLVSCSIALARSIPHDAFSLWEPNPVALHVVSEGLIAIAYFAIPVALVCFLHKQDSLPYPFIFLLFCAFSILCGTTHLINIWTLWHPSDWVSGAIKAVTAAIALYTAFRLVPLLSHLLTLKNPAELEAIAQNLARAIAQRQKVEVALSESEARYRSIVEDGTELIARCLPDGTLTFANPAYCRYFGLDREQVTGSRLEPFVFPSDREKVDRCWATLSAEHPVGTVEHRVIVKGEVRWMQWNNRLLFDRKGQLTEFQCVGRDISDRKRAEEALQERESTLSSFYDSAPMMMGIVELKDGDILHISDNAASAAFLGTTSEAIKQKFASEIGVSKNTLDWWLSCYQKSQATSQPVYFERSYETPQGVQYLSVVVSPILKVASKNPRFSYIVEDITERKKTEKQIQESLREKEILLKEIHHRVKNNLQVICSLLNLQMRSIRDDTVLAQFQDSQNRIRTMSLIHEKLYQSQKFSKINFSEYIRDLIGHLFHSYVVKTSNISLVFELDDRFFLDIDTAIPCGLIVNELVSNSIKYAFPTNQKGTISIKTYANEEKSLVLAISDNGCGIPENADPLKAKTLGLKLVKNLTNQLRGQLEVKRACGTHFKLTLTRIKLVVED